MSASASLFIRSLDNKKRVHLISKRRQTTMFLFLIMVVLPSAPVSLNAHHGLPLCLHPQNATVRLFRRIFCAHKTFWDRPARRGADVYALTFTAPVDGGRMGETLLPSPPIFSFSHFLSPLFLVAPGIVVHEDWFTDRCISSQWIFKGFYSFLQYEGKHGFNCTLHNVYVPIFKYFSGSKVLLTFICRIYIYREYSWHLFADIYRRMQCSGGGTGESLLRICLENICRSSNLGSPTFPYFLSLFWKHIDKQTWITIYGFMRYSLPI